MCLLYYALKQQPNGSIFPDVLDELLMVLDSARRKTCMCDTSVLSIHTSAVVRWGMVCAPFVSWASGWQTVSPIGTKQKTLGLLQSIDNDQNEQQHCFQPGLGTAHSINLKQDTRIHQQISTPAHSLSTASQAETPSFSAAWRRCVAVLASPPCRNIYRKTHRGFVLSLFPLFLSSVVVA